MKVFILTLLLSISAHAAINWTPVKESNGVKVFKAEVSGADVLAFKGEGVVDAPISRVATVIFDTKRATEWVVDLKESKLLKWTSDTEFLEYDHVGTPILIKDREFLSKVTMTIDPVARQMKFIYMAVPSDDAAPKTSYVRGELSNTTYILTSIENDTKTHIVGEILADPKGSIPKWLVNFFQKDWPVDTLTNLRKQVAKTDIVVEAKFQNMFTQPVNTAAPAATANDTLTKTKSGT